MLVARIWLQQGLDETGSVTARANAGLPRNIRTQPMKIPQLQLWEGSSRDIARKFGLSQSRFLEVVLHYQLHPYHYSRSSPLRMQFCEWLCHQHTEVELLLHNILWTDEARFTHEGVLASTTMTSPNVISNVLVRSVLALAFGPISWT
jgi:hypothetical protein